MTVPSFTQFHLESRANGLVHLVFDCPGRTMNVFSNAAIHELSAFAAWLSEADVKGVLIRSGKDNAFCAGADLTELGDAYDMIMQARPRDRFNRSFDHFFPLSRSIRALETAGKPIAAAIAGLALGGGCELALGAHYRVMVDDPKIGMGLPESLVGLLPGAGGTQRLPRLVGVDAALPILLDGVRLSGEAALSAGLVHELATAGNEVAKAEAWLLSAKDARQPWDRAGWQSPLVTPMLAERRALADRHNPAVTAILDCVEFGLPQSFEGAIRSEMAIFAHLIQRPEPRNMIQTLFLGKTDYDRLMRKGALPPFVTDVVDAVKDVPGDRNDPAVLRAISAVVRPWLSTQNPEELRIADYAVVKETGYPAFLGGPFTFAVRGFD
jgi:3-hydroxyacyl-CoA dehydrogenase / enoyl-CoA hydratase / 3-hydroxybutyryl-CoA epimerase